MTKPDAMPTDRQFTVLAELASATGTARRTAKQLHVRSDVLWRMEEAGWVGRNSHEEWFVKGPGLAALERWRNRNVEVTVTAEEAGQ